MENHDWAGIQGSPSAPYINNTLLPMASYCLQFYNSDIAHPSEPNYLWLEAGTNFDIIDNGEPFADHQNTTNHLVTYLNNAGISWKTYQEDISGLEVPLYGTNAYVPRHNPFVFFDDVTGTNNPAYPYGIAHIRPLFELAGDLTNNNVARYNFITPNLCNDMHDACAPFYDPILQGDTWLASVIPKIMNSAAYTNGGAIFITWDESDLDDIQPIGMIVLSPLAKGGGYFNTIRYSHSSTLRTFQEIFGVTPFLGAAANANNLSDLFYGYGLRNFRRSGSDIQFDVVGAIAGKTNVIEMSTNLVNWTPLITNIVPSPNFSITNIPDSNSPSRFYRAFQIP